jgi:hypothetical protein
MMLLLQVVGAGLCLILPGVLVVAGVRHEWTPGVAALVGAALGCLGIPMLSFCAAWFLGSSLSIPLVVAVAGAISLPAGGRILRRRQLRRGPA